MPTNQKGVDSTELASLTKEGLTWYQKHGEMPATYSIGE